MNKQGGSKNPFGGIEWTHYFGAGTGRTWNPVGGCEHGCRWLMPDGATAVCYAESTAEGVAVQAYPQGFAHHYWNPTRIDEPLLATAKSYGIFLDSMSDLFGAWVPEVQINAVLDTAAMADWHVFFSLTKNAPRLSKFADRLPKNMLVGVSMPPSIMWGHTLTRRQQEKMYLKSLRILEGLQDKGVRTWVSYEPLAWDVTAADRLYRELGVRLPIDWAVIGAASRGKEYIQPDVEWVNNLHAVCAEQNIPVFHKGNLTCVAQRREFPAMPVEPRR